MFTLVTDVLREPLVAPEMRAALSTLLARIPRVQLVGEVTLPSGRRGMAVARGDLWGREEMVFDTATGETLGERHVLTRGRGGQPAGTLLGYAVLVTSGTVDSVTARRLPRRLGAVRPGRRAQPGRAGRPRGGRPAAPRRSAPSHPMRRP